jgi:plastocyanin
MGRGRGIGAASLLLLAGAAHANTVRGSVAVPPEARADASSGHWRVENGVLPVLPRPPELRGEVVVVLEGPSKKDKNAEPPTLTVELHGLKMEPRVIVAPMGATVEFKNSDRVPHTLFAESALSIMAPEPTPAGQTRTQKFAAVGEYRIRDQEYPHIDGTVVVTQSPYASAVDDKGNFKLDVPEGNYTLRVWWHGAWQVTQPLEVAGRTTDVALTVPSKKTAEKGRGE